MSVGDKPTSAELVNLEADAKHLRERHRLYCAKSYGSRATEPSRLRDLVRAADLAENRLRAARHRASGLLRPS